MKPLRNNLNNKLGCGSFKPKKGRLHHLPNFISLGEGFISQKAIISAVLTDETYKMDH